MWSEVFSADMFERIRDDPDGGGVFSKAGGMAYRDCILVPGGSVDADDMLKAFARGSSKTRWDTGSSWSRGHKRQLNGKFKIIEIAGIGNLGI